MSYFIVNTLSSFLGEIRTHNEDSGQITFDCPACAEDKGLFNGDGKGKLSINYKIGRFQCWVCSFKNNMHGSVEKLISLYGPKSAMDTYKLHKETYNLNPNEIDYKVYKTKNVDLPRGFMLFSETDDNTYRFWNSKKYLNDRRIDDTIIKDYNIGFINHGYYKNRIVIPSYDSEMNLNYYVTRAIFDKMKPKYLNPDIDKSTLIFNEGRINWDTTVVLVEGVFDHIVIPNSIPMLGKHLYPKLKYVLFEKAKAEIVILLDPDAEENAEGIYKELNYDNLTGRINICTPPYGYDPSKIYELLGKDGIVNLLRKSVKLKKKYSFND